MDTTNLSIYELYDKVYDLSVDVVTRSKICIEVLESIQDADYITFMKISLKLNDQLQKSMEMKDVLNECETRFPNMMPSKIKDIDAKEAMSEINKNLMIILLNTDKITLLRKTRENAELKRRSNEAQRRNWFLSLFTLK